MLGVSGEGIHHNLYASFDSLEWSQTEGVLRLCDCWMNITDSGSPIVFEAAAVIEEAVMCAANKTRKLHICQS